MDEKELYDIISSQKDCFTRDCKHKCSKCQYQRDEKEIILAYMSVLDLIKDQKKIKTQFFNSGIEYAKSEFACLIASEKSKVDSLHENNKLSDLLYTQTLGLQRALELVKKISLKKKPNTRRN